MSHFGPSACPSCSVPCGSPAAVAVPAVELAVPAVAGGPAPAAAGVAAVPADRADSDRADRRAGHTNSRWRPGGRL